MNLNETLSAPKISNEENGLLNDDWIPKLQRLKYFKLFVPKKLGGLELNLTEAMPYLINTARFHGSLGWVHNLVAGANSFCTYFEEEVAFEIFNNNTIMCSGSGTPSGNIEMLGEQMKINGGWNKCTGAKWASYFTAISKTSNGQQITFICPSKYVEIKNDWHGFGMKATSTDKIEINEAILPTNYQFEIGNQKSFLEYPLAQTNFEVFARLCMSASWEGLVLRLFDLIELEVLHKKTELIKKKKTLDHELKKLNKLRRNLTEQLDKEIEFSKIETHQLNLKKLLSKQHQKINLIIEELIWNLGLSAIDERNLLNWAYKDLKVANQHYFI